MKQHYVGFKNSTKTHILIKYNYRDDISFLIIYMVIALNALLCNLGINSNLTICKLTNYNYVNILCTFNTKSAKK